MNASTKIIDGGATFVNKRDSWTMKVIAVFAGPDFMTSYVTTVKWPFCECRVYLATMYNSVNQVPEWLLNHELHHVWQFALEGWHGMLKLFATPRGRWIIERRAFLVDVRAGIRTIEQAVKKFRWDYRWPFPESWMPDPDEMAQWLLDHLNDPERAF